MITNCGTVKTSQDNIFKFTQCLNNNKRLSKKTFYITCHKVLLIAKRFEKVNEFLPKPHSRPDDYLARFCQNLANCLSCKIWQKNDYLARSARKMVILQ